MLIQPADRQKRLEKKYGNKFPDLAKLRKIDDPKKRGMIWREWIDLQVDLQKAIMDDKRLHWVRHRLMRWGHQWISTRDGRKWRELEANGNRIRRVFNIIGPGLDFRLGLLEEQRPGWRYEPIPGMGVDGRETAEAQQAVVEWYYKTQKMWRLFSLAAADAQTDGVSWLQVYIDKGEGPLIERLEPVSDDDDRYKRLEAAGYEPDKSGIIHLPLSPSGDVLPAGSKASSFRGGEIRTRRILAQETWADLEAETVRGPNAPARWFLIRRPRDLLAARLETDNLKLEAEDDAKSSDMYDFSLDSHTRWVMGLPPFPWRRTIEDSPQVWDCTLYLAPDEEDIGPEGMFVRTVGFHEHKTGKLPGRTIPMVRVTDGSPDAELFPRPVMSDWIADQVSINALGSKILEYARMHSGQRLMALEGTVVSETFSSIAGSIISYQGQKPDMMPAPRVSPDLWQMFIQMVQRLEDKMGHNDLSKGKVSSASTGFQDVSGRAVLGAREMYERQFGPMIRAAANSASDWAEIIVLFAQHLFTVPRLVPIVGRADLAKRIDNQLLSGRPSVYVDPETLMPMPRALRNQMLIDHLKEGIIDMKEYRKRSPYAEVRDLTFGDTDQWDRAQWVNTVIEENWSELYEADPLEVYGIDSGLGIFWQDDPDVHMRALEELIGNDRKPFQVRKLAADRWGIYAELARSKSFPYELELQGVPRPPAPLEVLGVPNMVPQATEPSEQQEVAPQPSGGGAPGEVPGSSAQPAVMGSPTSAPAGLPQASAAAPQPLGEMGQLEQAMER